VLQDWLPYVLIGVVAIALIAGTIVLARIAWRRQVRRYIVALVGRREAIEAALRTADGSLRTLAQGRVEDLLAFASTDSEERHTFSEIGARMCIQSQELKELPLPKRLWPLADALGIAATALCEQVGRVGDAVGEPALDALIDLELGEARGALAAADEFISSLSSMYDLDDPAVYGGGLYI
jgi:hypothetical protein